MLKLYLSKSRFVLTLRRCLGLSLFYFMPVMLPYLLFGCQILAVGRGYTAATPAVNSSVKLLRQICAEKVSNPAAINGRQKCILLFIC